MEKCKERHKAEAIQADVPTEAELERMKLLRVDNIITDVPVLAKEVIYGDIDEGSVLDYMKLLLR